MKCMQMWSWGGGGLAAEPFLCHGEKANNEAWFETTTAVLFVKGHDEEIEL